MKQHSSIKIIITILTCITTSVSATTIFSDNFETYASGTLLDNVNGWKGWDDVAASAGVVSNAYARSGNNSLEISTSMDAIHPFSGLTAGRYELSAWQYIERGSSGISFFIVNNIYTDGSPYSWTIQTAFNEGAGSNGSINDNLRSSNVMPIVTDQWIEIRNIIDLDNNTLLSYYNGMLLSSGTYITPSFGGPLEIANLDLYSNTGTAYYDDISLTQIPTPATFMLVSLGMLFMTRMKSKINVRQAN